MSEPKNFEEKFAAKQSEQNAAKLLMKQYVEQNINWVVDYLCEIVPLFWESHADNLPRYMNTVNATMATVSIDVVKDLYAKDFDDPDRRLMPCNPDDMQDAVRYLTRFITASQPLCQFLSKSNELAIRTCSEAFSPDFP